MSEFEVNNEIELGNAIWSSVAGDTIILKNGKYGNIPIKDGVNYEFKENATAADILGLGICGNGQWSAESVSFGNVSIKRPKIHKENIKLYYIFQKKLPFNSRLDDSISFVHANGVIITVIGNDKEGFILSGGDSNADDQLPKAVVNIFVPTLKEFDIKKSNLDYKISFYTGNFTPEERTTGIESHKIEVAKKEEVEKLLLNNSLGLKLNEFEYKALWALNSFIRDYSKIAEEKKIRGFSASEFKDGIGYTVTKNLSEIPQLRYQTCIEKHTQSKLDANKIRDLSVSFLSSQEYLLSDFIEYHLSHLNYSFAVIGMYQEFESLWEIDTPDKKEKWGFIERFTSSHKTKAYLAEMINARNNIAHSKKLITSHTPLNKLKTEWGAETLNEYEIYANKRPWHWVNSLQEFKKNFTDSTTKPID